MVHEARAAPTRAAALLGKSLPQNEGGASPDKADPQRDQTLPDQLTQVPERGS